MPTASRTCNRACDPVRAPQQLRRSWLRSQRAPRAHRQPATVASESARFCTALTEPRAQQEASMQAGGTARSRPILTSLPLQVFLYFGGWWDVLYFVLSVLLFVYKGFTLPYPQHRFAAEFAVQCLLVLVEPARLFLGSKGNKTEQPAPLALGMLLGLPMVVFHVYYLRFQTYVLKLEVLINALSIGFCSLQVLLGAAAALRFMHAARYA